MLYIYIIGYIPYLFLYLDVPHCCSSPDDNSQATSQVHAYLLWTKKMRGLIFVARIFYHLTYIIIDIGILLILNRFTDSFLGFFNFNEAYDTILTEQEQCTDPLMFSFPHKVMVCYIFFLMTHFLFSF